MADGPTINGHRFGWASMALDFDGVDQADIVEFNHKWSTERGKVRGKGTRIQGWTPGEDDNEADLTVNLRAWPKMLKALKEKHGKIRDAFFAMTVSTSETGEDEIITEEFIGCSLAGGEKGVKQGTDGLTVKIPLNVTRYKINGIDPQE